MKIEVYFIMSKEMLHNLRAKKKRILLGEIQIGEQVRSIALQEISLLFPPQKVLRRRKPIDEDLYMLVENYLQSLLARTTTSTCNYFHFYVKTTLYFKK